jgi:hypothetical protein
MIPGTLIHLIFHDQRTHPGQCQLNWDTFRKIQTAISFRFTIRES